MLRANRQQAQRLYQALREHLGQSTEGQDLLTTFEKDPGTGSAGLADYLQRELPGNDALGRKLAEALDPAQSSQLVTVVSGGQVDQIVNIARLGVLNLTVKRYLFLFKDVRQLITFLVSVLLVITATATLYWRVEQPAKMTGDFNIAVATFGEGTGDGETRKSGRASTISNRLFSFLDSEFSTSNLGIDVQLAHKNMPLVTDDRDAKKLAEQVNAQVVVFGTVQDSAGQVELLPRFWVDKSLYSEELTGPNALARPIVFSSGPSSPTQSPDSDNLTQRARLLVMFTKALAYARAGFLDQSQSILDSAIEDIEAQPYFDGQEVFYLMRSQMARLEEDFSGALNDAERALELNPEYARGWLALGNAYYDQVTVTGDWDRYDLLDQAQQAYLAAQSAKQAPEGAYVQEKANVALGNTYSVLAQILSEPQLFEEGTSYFSKVINEYEASHDQDFRGDIKELVAAAYFGMGANEERQQNIVRALEYYRTSIELSEDKELRERAERQIEILSAQD